MELKDVILSTLAEMEDDNSNIREGVVTPIDNNKTTQIEASYTVKEATQITTIIDTELNYLNSIRERLLVLFEGFQAPNNSNIEAKVDMTLNFLEYTLATIDERVTKLEKGNLN